MEVLKKTILQAVTTGITQGYWNAATNVPNLTPVNDTGDMWYVSVSGNTVLGDIDEWYVGDWATRYDTGWGKVIIERYDYTGSTGDTLVIPDFSVDYYAKIGLKQMGHDVGFMDAYSEPVEPIPPEPPEPPAETFYLVDSEGNPFVDNDNSNFIYE